MTKQMVCTHCRGTGADHPDDTEKCRSCGGSGQKVVTHQMAPGFVQQMQTTFELVNQVNAIGAFKRARADRAIEHAHADPREEQILRLERDVENVNWLIQVCDEATTIFRNALRNVCEKRKSDVPCFTPWPESRAS